jgi:4-carboxymuconolactone decarboxylase
LFALDHPLEENAMSELTPRESELAALGAALGSNCIPCVEYHVAESLRVGLTGMEIRAAIERADKVRQVPARKSLQAALGALGNGSQAPQEPAAAEARGCGTPVGVPGTSETAPEHSVGSMMAMMSKMMAACSEQSHAAGASLSSESAPAATSHAGRGCGCG